MYVSICACVCVCVRACRCVVIRIQVIHLVIGQMHAWDFPASVGVAQFPEAELST